MSNTFAVSYSTVDLVCFLAVGIVNMEFSMQCWDILDCIWFLN